MKTLAFYSFKGGVGRSLSLANIAYLLSREYEKKVGLIDLDIESSGLHHILNVKVSDDRDLLTFLLPKNREIVKLEHYVETVPQFQHGSSKVYLIPSLSNVTVLEQIKWDSSVDLFLRDQLFPTFSDVYDLDYLLIDGRTGLSKFSAIALMQADLVLLFSRLDKQNEYGISRMVKVCNEAGKPFLTIVSACPQIKGYKKQVEQFGEKVSSKIDCTLPYLGDLYFDEFIVSERSPNSGLAKAYKDLVKKIVEYPYDE